MISGGYEDSINVRSFIDLKHVADHLAVRISVVGIDLLFDGFSSRALHITDGDELNVLLWQHDAEVIAPAWTNADACQGDAIARSDVAITAEGFRWNKVRQRDSARCREAALKEQTPRSVWRLLGR